MILNLLDRMKLPFRKNKEFLSALYDILGFYPHDIEVYRIAFSHKSLSFHRDFNPKERRGKERRNRNSDNPAKPLNNERLEYLGDAVLESVVSDILFRHYPTKREGFLTSTRSKIVQRESLNRLAAEMGLERLIQAGQGTRMSHTNIGGNAFEALMGAIYLDRGYRFCHWFIANRVIGHYIDLDNVAQKEVNFKSKLLEWSQKNRISIDFKDAACEGEGKGFKTTITIEGIVAGRGGGRSKKESQQEASKEALTRMRRDAKMYDSLFRAKEKRTAMEAEESFALPKIDVIEQSISQSTGEKTAKKTPKQEVVLEKKLMNHAAIDSDAAYDAAYDENADFEVIDTPPAEPGLKPEDYLAKGLPLPPPENELEDQPVERPKKRKQRTPKTVNDAVKDFVKKDAENLQTPNGQTEALNEENDGAAQNETSVAKEKKNRRKNRKTETADNAELTDQAESTPDIETATSDDKGADSMTETVADEPAAMTDEEREMRMLEEEIIAEENRRLAFEAKQAAQKTRYEAEKARRAEKKALREAAQEPLQTATAVLIGEPESEPASEPVQPDVTEEMNLGFVVVRDLESVEPTEDKEENAEPDFDNVPQSALEESAEPDLDNIPQSALEEGAEPDLDNIPQSALEESAEPNQEDANTEEAIVDQEKAALASTLSDEAPLPKMRHLTLDDFVFGMEHIEQPVLDDADDENESLGSEGKDKEPTARKRSRSRSNKNKNANAASTDNAAPQQNKSVQQEAKHEQQETKSAQQPKPHKQPKAKPQNDEHSQAAKTAAGDASQTAEANAEANADAQPVSKRKRRRRRPRKKSAGDKPAESAAQ